MASETWKIILDYESHNDTANSIDKAAKSLDAAFNKPIRKSTKSTSSLYSFLLGAGIGVGGITAQGLRIRRLKKLNTELSGELNTLIKIQGITELKKSISIRTITLKDQRITELKKSISIRTITLKNEVNNVTGTLDRVTEEYGGFIGRNFGGRTNFERMGFRNRNALPPPKLSDDLLPDDAIEIPKVEIPKVEIPEVKTFVDPKPQPNLQSIYGRLGNMTAQRNRLKRENELIRSQLNDLRADKVSQVSVETIRSESGREFRGTVVGEFDFNSELMKNIQFRLQSQMLKNQERKTVIEKELKKLEWSVEMQAQ